MKLTKAQSNQLNDTVTQTRITRGKNAGSIVKRKKKLADRTDTSIKTRDKESAVLTS
ncbi:MULTISPECIES: hypothetical protein [unclassified Vibrio]|uniref:hypothetical protein n=1 Tax=unclassified Vibrio TaxID=2614977 RepID=UPI0029654392|nr:MULTISPECIES: hypothetical protein [unclassified Vibrio]MDW1584227.1 hypothetical protein [Vibrio sp. Vb2897]MDW1642447.1 hypothetical protein [Vibrio sp. Vb2896]